MFNFKRTTTVVSIVVGLMISSLMAARHVQISGEREVEDKIPKHLPVTIKVRPEKEKQFRDLNNENWVRDLEFEVTNTGDKPIYSLSFTLAPDFGKPPTERTLGLTILYGRDQLVDIDAALTPEDIPIKPGEKVFLRIRADEIEGWYHVKTAENWSEKWSRPGKVALLFEELNFGDGTGFNGGDGEPHKKRSPETAALATPKT